MSGVNKAIIVGNLGRDPELRYTQSGNPVATLNVATSRKYKNKQTDEMVEETEWHRVTVWGKAAENANNYLSKGSQVYVEGRLRTSSYEKDGTTRYTTEIVAENVQYLSKNSGGSNYQTASDGHGFDPGATPATSADDDIPF